MAVGTEPSVVNVIAVGRQLVAEPEHTGLISLTNSILKRALSLVVREESFHAFIAVLCGQVVELTV